MTSLRRVSWSVSLKYQLDVVKTSQIGRFELRTNEEDVTKTSQVGRSHSRTSRDVLMTSQHGPRRLNLCEI